MNDPFLDLRLEIDKNISAQDKVQRTFFYRSSVLGCFPDKVYLLLVFIVNDIALILVGKAFLQ